MPDSYRVANLIDALRLQAQMLVAEIKRLENALSVAPEGRLRVNVQHGKARYYYLLPDNRPYGKYTTDINLVRSLATKKYNSIILGEYKKELESINAAIKSVMDSQTKPVELIPHATENLVTPTYIDKSDDACAREFLNKNYYTLGFEEWDPEHYSLLGRKTRSKSEADICNCLDKADVPYRYEERIVLDGREYYPDFTCLNKRTRTQYYWEHFGRPTDPSYAERMVSKLNIYREHDIYPGKNLIMTFETGEQPLNVRIINDVIEKYLL